MFRELLHEFASIPESGFAIDVELRADLAVNDLIE